jgi:hypothetical protein
MAAILATHATRSEAVSNDKQSSRPQTAEPTERGRDDASRPVSDAMLAIFLAALAAVLVLGYLFLNKLADISRQEDCMLSRSRSCAAIELIPHPLPARLGRMAAQVSPGGTSCMMPERAATRAPAPIVTCGAGPTEPPSTAKSSSVTLPLNPDCATTMQCLPMTVL